MDHMDFYKSVDILTKIWYKTNQFYVTNNTLKMDCLKFLNEEGKTNSQENSLDDETIDINTAECEDLNDYVNMINYTNAMLYMKKNTDDTSYIIKRLFDNEKEYEYAMCIDKKFVLKQCNAKCQCHEVIKNDRPKEITHCNSYKVENTLNCLVDGDSKEIGVKEYFSVARQIKIEDYYLMDYFCWNQTYSRGNYKIDNSMKIMKTSISYILLLLFLLL